MLENNHKDRYFVTTYLLSFNHIDLLQGQVTPKNIVSTVQSQFSDTLFSDNFAEDHFFST